jgi:hypothetical protein
MAAKDGKAGRGPGRPRVWASEAERKRAYRARLAADLAEPVRLRLELRDARKRIGELERALAATRGDLGRSADAVARVAGDRDRYRAANEKLRDENSDLWRRLSGGMW